MPIIEDDRSYLERFVEFAFFKPAIWVRENIVTPNRPKTYYYHRKYPRVPTIDECYTDDFPCIFEADQQFKRDYQVETEIVRILRRRWDDCTTHEMPHNLERCKKVKADFQEAELNWFIKYGDMGWKINTQEAYMKQKHRLVFERRKREEAERKAQEQGMSDM